MPPNVAEEIVMRKKSAKASRKHRHNGGSKGQKEEPSTGHVENESPLDNTAGEGGPWTRRLFSRWGLFWTLFSGAVVLLTFYLGIVDLRDKLHRRRSPNIEIRFYDKSGNKLSLAEEGPTVLVDEKSIQQNAIEIPLNLAVRNREDQPLEIVKLDLEYPSDLDLHSGGRAKIDPAGKRLIYERDLGVIEPSVNFTPLKEIDTIILPATFVVDRTVVLMKDGVPMYVYALIGVAQGYPQKKQIPITLAIYCKDRPPLHREIVLNLDAPGVGVDVDIPDGKSVDIGDNDKLLLDQLRKRPDRVLENWTRFYRHDRASIHYQRVVYKRGIFELVFVNDELRRVIADLKGDGVESFEFILGDGSPHRKLVPSSPTRMAEWREQDVQ